MSAADVIVIGSGAGGSVMAYELARRGLRVTVVERGSRFAPSTFDLSEPEKLARLYKHGGLQTTEDHDLTIAQGCTVGGSTVVNGAVWSRCDLDRVLVEWQALGAAVDRDLIEQAYDELERNLHVAPIDPALANRGARVFVDGARRTGVPARYVSSNRRECLGCGGCNYGCRYNRKTSMLATYIPWAEELGTRVVDACEHVRIENDGRRTSGISFVRRGIPETISADRVVVSAGAIGSSAVLLRSGIKVGGRVGRGLHVLGGTLVAAEMPEPVDAFDGVGASCAANIANDVLLETHFALPALFSLGLGGWFATHFDRMLRYRNFVQAGAMVATQPTGRVSVETGGRLRVDVGFSSQDIARLKTGIAVLSRIWLAGGAIRVLPATWQIVEITSSADLADIDRLIQRPDDLILASAHPQGGNAMSADQNRGVVGTDFRVHGMDNIFVADASVFPSNIRTNCQATVMAMSHLAARFVSGEMKDTGTS